MVLLLTHTFLSTLPTLNVLSTLPLTRRKHHGEGVRDQKRLVVTLWNIAAPTFVPAGFCQLLTVLCQASLPLLVRALLQVLEDNPSTNVVSEGMPYAIGISGVLFVNGFGNHRQRHLALKSGIAMRAAVVNVIYEHVLKLSPKGRVGLTSGEVANLVAVDTQKLFEVAQDGHLIWSLPLSIVLVTIALVFVLGPTTLVGIAVLICFVPLIERITSRMLAIRQKRTKTTDERVQIVSSMLQGVRTSKAICLETKLVTFAFTNNAESFIRCIYRLKSQSSTISKKTTKSESQKLAGTKLFCFARSWRSGPRRSASQFSVPCWPVRRRLQFTF
jgi:ABC-type multidrug transport system fused ATPase/permease subunit